MQKNFKSLLEDMDKNQMVYVGTKDGSNWIVIETAEKILENLDALDSLLHEQVVRSNLDAIKKTTYFPMCIVHILSKIRGCVDEDELDKLKYELNSFEGKYVAAIARKKLTKKALDKWIILSERAVVETYEHTVDIPGISVLIEGFENGTLWFKHDKQIV